MKVTVRFKGRENAHPELGRAVLEEVAKRLNADGAVERMPLLEGRSMSMIMTPTVQKVKAPVAPTAPAAPVQT
ncbi:MAG: hypothetical protein NVSMB22_03750 [Chloroflexota bacterium]